ncbi:hypothetical protein L1887_05961 [Cichorium endivia]|nr:hypothetical protein L1887_05961 [Cichorium endivia]
MTLIQIPTDNTELKFLYGCCVYWLYHWISKLGFKKQISASITENYDYFRFLEFKKSSDLTCSKLFSVSCGHCLTRMRWSVSNLFYFSWESLIWSVS